jgi:hemerythrin superfamily protein
MPTTTASTASTQQESALRVLKDDHRDVEELFSQFEATGERAKKTREAIVAKIIEALSLHASIEETVFYPAVRERLAEQESTVLEALEEHHVVKLTLSELDAMSADDERFEAKVTVLMEMVRHHVREEEKEMFPMVRAVMSRSDWPSGTRRPRTTRCSSTWRSTPPFGRAWCSTPTEVPSGPTPTPN